MAAANQPQGQALEPNLSCSHEAEKPFIFLSSLVRVLGSWRRALPLPPPPSLLSLKEGEQIIVGLGEAPASLTPCLPCCGSALPQERNKEGRHSEERRKASWATVVVSHPQHSYSAWPSASTTCSSNTPSSLLACRAPITPELHPEPLWCEGTQTLTGPLQWFGVTWVVHTGTRHIMWPLKFGTWSH